MASRGAAVAPALHRDESGQGAVELALAMPFLLLVLVGAVQLALVHHARHVAQAAAQEGARLAAAEGRSLAEGAERARELLEAGLGSHADGFSVTARERAGAVHATASGRYPLLIPWVRRLAVEVEASSQVRSEGFRGGP